MSGRRKFGLSVFALMVSNLLLIAFNVSMPSIMGMLMSSKINETGWKFNFSFGTGFLRTISKYSRTSYPFEKTLNFSSSPKSCKFSCITLRFMNQSSAYKIYPSKFFSSKKLNICNISKKSRKLFFQCNKTYQSYKQSIGLDRLIFRSKVRP